MLEFRKQLEAKIEGIAQSLTGKVLLGMVEEETTAPFAVYTIRHEPVRTKTGIAGYNSYVDISVYDIESKRLELTRSKIINGLDRQRMDGKRLLYTSDEYGVNLEKTVLNAYTITFKIR